jgi:hypothetical protein
MIHDRQQAVTLVGIEALTITCALKIGLWFGDLRNPVFGLGLAS